MKPSGMTIKERKLRVRLEQKQKDKAKSEKAARLRAILNEPIITLSTGV